MDMDVDTIGQFQLMYLHHLWCPYSFSAFIVMVHARVARLPKSVRTGPKVSFCSRRTDYKGTENLKQVVLLKATLWQGTVSSYRKINFPYFSTQANVHSITHVRKCLQSPGDTIGNQKLFCFWKVHSLVQRKS